MSISFRHKFYKSISVFLCNHYYKGVLAFLLLTGFINKDGSAQSQPADYVNPFIGASTSAGKAGVFHGLGKTFPGAATPFGLVQLSPNTVTGGDNGSGYSYEHTSLEGFAFTQMSGVGWYGDLGNFLVMPSIGPLSTFAGRMDHPGEGYRSAYSKEDEKAAAGYYAATLTRYHIRAEMSAAPHSGILRFTFPENARSRIQIDLARRVGGTSTLQYIRLLDAHTIQGWMKCTPEGGGWGNGDGKASYTVYFYAQFSKPVKNFGVWSANIPGDWTRKREEVESARYQEKVAGAAVLKGVKEKEGKHLGFYTEFATKSNEQVLLKAGISFVSMDGAKQNLQSEIEDWNFDKTAARARELWNQALGKISVEGGKEEEKTVFYTALYHTMIDPRAFSDIDGKYQGGNGLILQSKDFTRRTIFSGWDVFRSQFPLQTIINPKVVNDMINSLVELGDESGNHYLERWELLNAYSGCMIGNPAVAVIADAYAKGIRNFNVDKAYDYAKNSVVRFGNGDKGYTGGENSISRTLEYAYSDWCLSQLAGRLGKKEDEGVYGNKAGNYRNVFDDSAHWFRPRKEDGSWEPWPANGRLKQDYGTVESNPYQQGWFVPQDIPGMVQLMGGRDKVKEDLENFFERTPENMMWNDYYNHANEPVHHVPFLFNSIGFPWLTQKWTRAICSRAYHNSVEGLVGNEDVGQMSAWYVLAASGLHPVCPGTTRYEITSPVFSRVVIGLAPAYAKGKSFTIIAKDNSPENIYIQSATLNGWPYELCYLDYADIAAGGVLELKMGATPAIGWGVSGAAVPAQKNEQVLPSGLVQKIDQPLSAGPVRLIWEEAAPGVWKARIGLPQKIDLLKAAGAKPRLDALQKLGGHSFPLSQEDCYGEIQEGKIYLRFPLQKEERIYGLGLNFKTVNQRGRILNLHVDHYGGADNGRTHAPVPFYVSDKGYGILVNSAQYITVYAGTGVRKDSRQAPMVHDRNADTSWEAQPYSDAVEIQVPATGTEVYLFAGNTAMEAVQRYNLFNGGGVLPPKWGLGFTQRVPTLSGQDDVRKESAAFAAHDFPLDFIGLEPGWQSSSYPCTFEWDKTRFPNPAAFTREMLDKGIRLNLWLNPYLSPASSLYQSMKLLSGSHTVWNGLVPDMNLPAAREQYKALFEKQHLGIGISGYKIDEIDGYDNWLWPDIASFPSGISGEQMRQVFGLELQSMTRDWFREKNTRTYGLARASNAGASSLPYVLYDDYYDHRDFITALCNSSFIGVLWTPEVRASATAEEWLRRMQSVCFSPMAMLNAWADGTKPWSYPEVEKQVHEAAMLRMQLFPYLYTCFAQYCFEGKPPVRAMNLVEGFSYTPVTAASGLNSVTNPYAMAMQKDIKDQFMLGDYLLVAPMFTGMKKRTVVLPRGNWYDFYTGKYAGNGEEIEITPGLDRIPLYVKDGGIIPMIPPAQHTPRKGEILPLEIRFYGTVPGSFSLYDDDGETFGYEKGDCYWYRLRAVKGRNGKWNGTTILPKGKNVPVQYSGFNWKFMSAE